MTEAEFLAALRRLPLHPGALGLADDAARLSGDFVVTTDTLVEGVHFLPDDPPGDVAWKLLAVNLSDLAAKGATPVAVLLNYPLSGGDVGPGVCDRAGRGVARVRPEPVGGGYGVVAERRATRDYAHGIRHDAGLRRTGQRRAFGRAGRRRALGLRHDRRRRRRTADRAGCGGTG